MPTLARCPVVSPDRWSSGCLFLRSRTGVGGPWADVADVLAVGVALAISADADPGGGLARAASGRAVVDRPSTPRTGSARAPARDARARATPAPVAVGVQRDVLAVRPGTTG